MTNESNVRSDREERDYSSTRPVEQILAKAKTRVINIKDLTGPGQGYAMFSEVIGTATSILPDKRFISTWAAEGILNLMKPLVTPCEDSRYQLVWGLRGVVTALAHHDIGRIPVLVTDYVTQAEMDELAFIDVYALPLEISLRADASGIGRLFMAFSARTEIVPKALLKKYFPAIRSLRRLELVTGIYVPPCKERKTGPTPQTTPEAEPGASSCMDEEPEVEEGQGHVREVEKEFQEPVARPDASVQQTFFFDSEQPASGDWKAEDGMKL